MKKTIILSATVLSLIACSSPQKKAEKDAQKDSNAAEASANAATEQQDAAVTNAVRATVYANMAAASAAVSKIEAPKGLSNLDAKSMARDFGTLVNKRINATTADDADKFESEMKAFPNDVATKTGNKKITVADSTALMNYSQALVKAALDSQ